MFRLSILGIAVLAMAATFAAVAGVRDSVPARAAGFGQATLTRQGGGSITVQTGRAGTASLVSPYGTGSRAQTPATVIFMTQAPATVCSAIGGIAFTLQAGGAACVGASDRAYWEPQGTGTRIHADGSFIDVTATPATVAALIAAVP